MLTLAQWRKVAKKKNLFTSVTAILEADRRMRSDRLSLAPVALTEDINQVADVRNRMAHLPVERENAFSLWTAIRTLSVSRNFRLKFGIFNENGKNIV